MAQGIPGTAVWRFCDCFLSGVGGFIRTPGSAATGDKLRSDWSDGWLGINGRAASPARPSGAGAAWRPRFLILGKTVVREAHEWHIRLELILNIILPPCNHITDRLAMLPMAGTLFYDIIASVLGHMVTEQTSLFKRLCRGSSVATQRRPKSGLGEAHMRHRRGLGNAQGRTRGGLGAA